MRKGRTKVRIITALLMMIMLGGCMASPMASGIGNGTRCQTFPAACEHCITRTYCR